MGTYTVTVTATGGRITKTTTVTVTVTADRPSGKKPLLTSPLFSEKPSVVLKRNDERRTDIPHPSITNRNLNRSKTPR